MALAQSDMALGAAVCSVQGSMCTDVVCKGFSNMANSIPPPCQCHFRLGKQCRNEAFLPADLEIGFPVKNSQVPVQLTVLVVDPHVIWECIICNYNMRAITTSVHHSQNCHQNGFYLKKLETEPEIWGMQTMCSGTKLAAPFQKKTPARLDHEFI